MYCFAVLAIEKHNLNNLLNLNRMNKTEDLTSTQNCSNTIVAGSTVEIWVDINGYEGLYQISNKQRVKSLPRIVLRGNPKVPCQLKERILSSKINDVVLINKEGRKTYDVNSLYLIHFEHYKPTKKTVVIISDKVKTISRRKMTEIAKFLTVKKTSKYCGVSISRGLFRSAIQINGKEIFLGRYITEKEAKNIYDIAKKNEHLFMGSTKQFREILSLINES